MSDVVLSCRWCKGSFRVARVRGRYPRSCAECAGTDQVQAARVRAALEDALASPEGMLMLAEFGAAAEAAVVASGDRVSLRRAIVFVAGAGGPGALREALIGLAGVAIRWASTIPPRTTPDPEPRA